MDGRLTIIPPKDLWYEMNNGVYEQVHGAIINGAWRPVTIIYYVFIMVAPQKVEWIEIDEELAYTIDWNKIGKLIEDKYADGTLQERMKKVRETLIKLGVVHVEQVPQAVINGQPVQYMERLVVNSEYHPNLESDDGDVNLPIMDITEQVKYENG